MERLDPSDGPRLLALAGELVWATTWMADANEVVAPRLGLPVLPLVDWPDGDAEPEHGVQWKTVSLTVLRSPSPCRVQIPVLAAGVFTWPPTGIFARPADSGGSARVIRLNRSGGRSVFIKGDLGLHGAIR